MTSHTQTASLKLQLFGHFDLTLGDVSLTRKIPRKAQVLIALLVLDQEYWLPRKELAALLWPADDNDNQNVSFRQQLSLLRKALGDEKWRIKEEHHSLQLDLTNAFVDVLAFQENMRLADQSGEETSLEEAYRLYRGSFMEEHQETCLQEARNAFQKTYLKLLMGLAELAVMHRNPEQALHYLKEGFATAPEQETIVRFLMRLLMERDEREEARTVFLSFQQALRSGRKREPEPETLALWNALQSSLETKQNSVSSPPDKPAPRSEPHRRRLPNPLSSLIGREEEIAQVSARFYRHSLVTLVGPGGAGKTRLATELARRLQATYPAGTAFADLSALSENRGVLPILLKIAEALPDLNIRETPGQPFTQVLAAALAEQSLLLVIDNCEQVISECAGIIKELLETCPALHILATSREELRIPGESVYTVPALSLPSQNILSRPETLIYSDAVRLFVERVRDRQPDFEINAENTFPIEKICLALDGMPLAIELAAVMTDTLTINDLEAQISNDYWFLSGQGDRTRPERYQTLHATIDWSYRALSTNEQALLNAVSVLAGEWTLEAARALFSVDASSTRNIVLLLSALVHKSMVVAEKQGPETRYRLLGTIQQFAREKLAESGEESAIRERHAAYFENFAAEMDKNVSGASQKEAFDRIHAEQENLRAAMHWAQETEHVEAGLNIATSIWQFWFVRAYFEEGLEWLTTFARMPGDAAEELRQRALNAAGNLAYAQQNYSTARYLFDEALAIAQQREDPLACARISANIGNVANAEGFYEEARTRFEQSLALFRQINDRVNIARMLGNLASTASHEENYSVASEHQREALTLFRELKNQQNICLSLNNLADTLLRMGQISEVPSILMESLTLGREIESHWDIMHGLYNLLSLAMKWNAPEQAALILGVLETYQEKHKVYLPPFVVEEAKQFSLAIQASLGEHAFEAARERGHALPPGHVSIPLLTG